MKDPLVTSILNETTFSLIVHSLAELAEAIQGLYLHKGRGGVFVLHRKVVVITGASGSLGPTVAGAFSRAGASLALAGRNEGSLVTLLDSFGLPENRRMATSVDLTVESASRHWADAVLSRFGRVDVVLHLVGGYRGGTTVEDIPSSDWEFIHDMLVRTTFNVVRAFGGALKANGWGRFIGVSSPRAQAPTAKSAVYSMGKAASDALLLALADEFRGTGATANLILVESIDPPESLTAEREKGMVKRGSAEAGSPKKGTSRSTPAEEIAAAMLFLCSEEAANVNGVRLPLTGRG
jgi:NAD(P)-dependent dehydrogenase (short-subunit alcohol dehydrogenase family)